MPEFNAPVTNHFSDTQSDFFTNEDFDSRQSKTPDKLGSSTKVLGANGRFRPIAVMEGTWTSLREFNLEMDQEVLPIAYVNVGK